jgi:hypothetical protein
LISVNARGPLSGKIAPSDKEDALIEQFYTWGVAGLMGLFLVVLAVTSWFSKNG